MSLARLAFIGDEMGMKKKILNKQKPKKGEFLNDIEIQLIE